MSRFASTSIFATIFCAWLSGCGGGASLENLPPPTPPRPPPPSGNDYETIYSEAATSSNLHGVGFAILQTGQEANEIALLEVSGSVRHDVGPLSLDNGQYAFTGTMYYVIRISAETHSSEGVAGIVAAASDVPSIGAADYSGVAFGSGATVSGRSFELLLGNAAAAVKFLTEHCRWSPRVFWMSARRWTSCR